MIVDSAVSFTHEPIQSHTSVSTEQPNYYNTSQVVFERLLRSVNESWKDNIFHIVASKKFKLKCAVILERLLLQQYEKILKRPI